MKMKGLFNPEPVRFDGDHEPLSGDWMRTSIEDMGEIIRDTDPDALAPIVAQPAVPALTLEMRRDAGTVLLHVACGASMPEWPRTWGAGVQVGLPYVYSREFLYIGSNLYYSTCCFFQLVDGRAISSLGLGFDGEVDKETEEELRFVHQTAAVFFLSVNRILLATPAAAQYYKVKSRIRPPRSLTGRPTLPGKIRILDLGTVPQMREKIARLPGPPRTLERHCPAWGVRGHYRHYKDGRCVYVRPCIKGPDRSQYCGREYELLVDK